MTPELRAALESLSARLGFAVRALDHALAVARAEEAPKRKPHHPACVALRCGEFDCGNRGPCYIDVRTWRQQVAATETSDNQTGGER